MAKKLPGINKRLRNSTEYRLIQYNFSVTAAHYHDSYIDFKEGSKEPLEFLDVKQALMAPEKMDEIAFMVMQAAALPAGENGDAKKALEEHIIAMIDQEYASHGVNEDARKVGIAGVQDYMRKNNVVDAVVTQMAHYKTSPRGRA